MHGRRRLVLALQAAFVVAVFGYGGHVIADYWRQTRGQADLLRLRAGPLLLATALVLATYALLIQLWRVVLDRWGERLSFLDATRIWSVSNLGRFVPGRVAQIGTMAYLARQREVSAVAATGSALLNTLINIAAGIVVALVAGGRFLEREYPGAQPIAVAMVGAAAVGLLILPWLLPRLASAAARLLRRPLERPVTIPASAIWITAAGNLGAWILYGVAFRLFTHGVRGVAPGETAGYVAAYSVSYILGYIVVFAPGGLGVREGALATAMVGLGLANAAEAALVAIASRLWLTVLEVLPGLVFLALAALRRRSPSPSGDAPT
ncbi:MAG TPA: lysylphosphatidylglycerol synthase domain-containing protein [Gemmatimonadaceae bacterium]|nr:lysylphosphatidylglycerol synthase domain-containing protein [Gemmatimonadaceae bacterium]